MANKRIVITGVNGFVGHHVARALFDADVSVIGVGNNHQLSTSLASVVEEYYQQDLAVAWPDIPQIDGVIHLAALAVVGQSFERPQEYITTNSAIMTNLCEYYLRQDKKPRILLASSGTLYNPNQPLPINEDGEIAFSSPYSVSKALNEHQAAYYKSRGLDCVVVRPFNHIGPGQAKGFILPDFYDRIVNTKESVIRVGNINTKRDYTDVRDVANAYTSLLLAPEIKSFVYNVCSGKSLSGRELLELLKKSLNRNDITFEIDPALIRPTDIPEIIGDASRLQLEIGWIPQIPISQTIRDFVASNS